MTDSYILQLDIMMPIVAASKILRPLLPSVAEHNRFSLVAQIRKPVNHLMAQINTFFSFPFKQPDEFERVSS